MRIMQISGALAGAQKTIEEAIHRYLVNAGHESRILYACGQPSLDTEICYENKLENILCRAGRKYICKTSRFAALQTKRLIRQIKQYQPDLIHLHVIHHGYTDHEMLLKFLAKAKIPVVYTMHDMWAVTGGCYHYTTNGCSGPQTGCQNCPANRKLLDMAQKSTATELETKKNLLGRIEKLYVVTVSDWVGEQMKNSFLADRPIQVILNGMDLPDVADLAVKKESPAHRPIRLMGVAASWSNRKGVDKLFRLAQLLDDDYQIQLVGGVTQELKDSAPANVVFTGYCADKAQLMEQYAQADLHISASLEETFGMTFVEAALVGTRSVGFASTAITQTLKNVYGVAVEEYTAEAMCQAIQDTVATKTTLDAEEIARIREKLSAEKMAETYFAVYEKMA